MPYPKTSPESIIPCQTKCLTENLLPRIPLSESARHKADNCIDTQNTINSYSRTETFNTDKILEITQITALLYEQVDSLEQELQYKAQTIEQYQQELMCTISEMSIVNSELQHVLSLKTLEVDGAIQLAQGILSNNKSTNESLANLISAIYGVLVMPDQLG